MSKLTEKDIIIKNPGEQLEEAILEQFLRLEDFAREMRMKESSIYTYLHTEPYGSKKFRSKLPFVLNKEYKEIVIDASKQIDRYLETIKREVKNYNKEEDRELFDTLVKLCDLHSLGIEKAKTYRLISKHHFFADRKEIATEYIKYAIEQIKPYNEYTLLLSFYTDLIMYYYYQKQYRSGETICHEAESIIKKIYNKNNEIFFEFYYRAGVLYNKGDCAMAREMFNAALTCQPSEEYINSTLIGIALSYKNEKNYSLAIKYYKRVLDEAKEDFNKSELYNNIASLYNDMGNTEEAVYYNNLSFEYLSCDETTYKDMELLCMITRCETSDDKTKLESSYILIDYLNKGIFSKVKVSATLCCLIGSALYLHDIDILHTVERIINNYMKTEKNNSEYYEELERCLGKILIAYRALKGGV